MTTRVSTLSCASGFRRPTLACLVLCIAAGGALAESSSTPSPEQAATAKAKQVTVNFGAQGLELLAFEGTAISDASDGGPAVLSIGIKNADGSVQKIDQPKPRTTTFDAATRSTVLTYEWGTVTVVYTLRQRGLDCKIIVQNTSDKALTALEIATLAPRVPRHMSSMNATFGAQGGVVGTARGVVGVINESREFRLALNHNLQQPSGGVPLVFSSVAPRKTAHPIVNNDLLSSPGSPEVEPGKSLELSYALALGGAGESLMSKLFSDYRERMDKAFPVTLDWPDRRPMGMIFMAHPAMKWKTNPRGFNFGRGEKHDVFTEEGLAIFGKELMKYADTNISYLKAMDAQGVIVWNLEGEEVPHPISYAGDPRVLDQVAPEMGRFADEFMAKFRDAGLKTGVTIRPTDYYARSPENAQSKAWFHREVADPVKLMSEKIQYAQKRWGTTIFYLDSNVFGQTWVQYDNAKANVSNLMPVSMMQKLHELHPDCLIIPEWTSQEYFRFSAPYASPNLGEVTTYPWTRDTMPKAFRCVAVGTKLLEDQFDTYVAGVGGGDVLMFQSWYATPDQAWIKLVYREAELRKTLAAMQAAPMPIDSPDEAVRYALARSLAEKTTPEALEQAAKLLDDPSPHVRRATMLSIAKQRKVTSPRVVTKLINIFSREPTEPRHVLMIAPATAAVGGLGESAVPVLMKVIGDVPFSDLITTQEDPNSPARAAALRALGATGTKDKHAHQVIIETISCTEPSWARLKGPAAEAAGALKLREAVPGVLALLERTNSDEGARLSALRALGQIGDRRAIRPLIAHIEYNWKNLGLSYSGQWHANDSLAKITGVTLSGKAAWTQWLASNPDAAPPAAKP